VLFLYKKVGLQSPLSFVKNRSKQPFGSASKKHYLVVGMELCSLDDAFPDIGKQGPSKEERRAARKKAKRCKGPANDYLTADERQPPPVPEGGPPTDPDRPAVKRLGEVPALMSYNDAFPDLGEVARDSVPFRTRPSTNGGEEFRMPTLPGANTTFADPGLPGYFGKDVDDEEGFADYSPSPTDTAGYRMSETGVAKAQGSPVLPTPSVADVWKPLTPAGATTAYFGKLPAPGGRVVERVEPDVPMQVVKPTEAARRGGASVKEPELSDVTRDQLMKRIQDLQKRLEELETKASAGSRQDILVFVGAGLFLLVSFDLAMRARR
jgi:hypothetical protein